MPGPLSMIQVTMNHPTRELLQGWVRWPTKPAGLVRRARALLLLEQGQRLAPIARQVGLSDRHLRKWARRFCEQGVAGLREQPGRPERKRDDRMSTTTRPHDQTQPESLSYPSNLSPQLLPNLETLQPQLDATTSLLTSAQTELEHLLSDMSGVVNELEAKGDHGRFIDELKRFWFGQFTARSLPVSARACEFSDYAFCWGNRRRKAS